jgi:phosphatidylserine decarboxylase
MPQDKRHHHRFLSVTMEHVDSHPKPLHPVLVEFKDKVERDTRLYMLFQAMFEEVSGTIHTYQQNRVLWRNVSEGVDC